MIANVNPVIVEYQKAETELACSAKNVRLEIKTGAPFYGKPFDRRRIPRVFRLPKNTLSQYQQPKNRKKMHFSHFKAPFCLTITAHTSSLANKRPV
jgi:hypothetical protein